MTDRVLTRAIRRKLIALLVTVVLRSSVALPSLAAPTVAEMAAEVGLTPDAIAQVEKGEMVETTPTDRSDRELAMGMVFFVRAPLTQVVQAFQGASDLKADPHVTALHEVSGAGTLADFEDLRLAPHGSAEVQRYLTATPGQTLNLSTTEIAAFRALGAAGQPEVEAQLRSMLLARLRAYRTQGLDGGAPYDRGEGVQRSPAEELRRHSAAKILGKYSPAFREVLLHYPAARPAGLEERFFWLVYDLDDRPTLTLRHRMALPMGDAFVVADREFYVSQGYNVEQAHAAFLSAKDGTMVFYVTRTSTDRVSGFGASAKHAIGRHLMTREIQSTFNRMRAAFGTH
jgi:DNA-binding XRE family transcriptional regulator